MATVLERPEIPTDAGSGGPRGDRFVAAALLVVALLLLGFQALAGEVIPPLAAFGLVYAGLGIAVARRRSRWLLGVAIALTLAHVIGNVPFMSANLQHPESPASFLNEAFVMLAALTALGGAVLGLRGSRSGGRRRLAVGAGALAGVALVVSLVAAAGVESQARQPGDVALETVGAAFPAVVEIPADGASLWVDNVDPFHHTFVVEGADLHQVLPASSAVRMDVDLPAGTYRYFCDVPGHERMEGELRVR